MAFERSPAVDAAIEKALRFLASVNRGEVIPWHEFERRVGITRYGQHWSAFRQRINKELRKRHGLVIRCKSGRGPFVLTVDDHIDRPSAERHRKALRQFTRAAAETACVNDTDLSLEQKFRKYKRLELNRDGRKGVLRKVRQGSVLDKGISADIPRMPRSQPA